MQFSFKTISNNFSLILSAEFHFISLSPRQIKKYEQGVFFGKKNLVSTGHSKAIIKAKFHSVAKRGKVLNY